MQFFLHHQRRLVNSVARTNPWDGLVDHAMRRLRMAEQQLEILAEVCNGIYGERGKFGEGPVLIIDVFSVVRSFHVMTRVNFSMA